MPKLTVSNLGALDGVYECQVNDLTTRELHLIKQLSGVRAGELTEALLTSDAAAVMALAVVVLQRQGKQPDVDRLFDAEFGSLRFEFFDNTRRAGKGDERPPARRRNAPASSDDENGENATSG